MRKTLPIALAATAGAAATATPAVAYDSVNATLNDGKGDPKPRPNPQPEPRGNPQPQADPVRSEPAAKTPPPRAPEPPPAAPEPAAETVARSVSKVGKTLSGEPQRDRRHEPDRHQPIGRQADPAPAQPATSINATLNDGQDARRQQRRPAPPKRDRRPQHQPPTSSVTALSHDSYKVTKAERIQQRLDRARERTRYERGFPRVGVPVSKGPSVPKGGLPDPGDSTSLRALRALNALTWGAIPLPKWKELSRSETITGRGGRDWQMLTVTRRDDRDTTRIGWPPPGLGILTTGLDRDPKAKNPDSKLMRKASVALKRMSRYGFEWVHYDGRRTTVRTMLDTDHMEELDAGEGRSPNPRRPRSLDIGEWVSVSKDAYSGDRRKLKIIAEGGYLSEEGTRRSTAIKRIAPNRVRVFAGDEETLLRQLTIGPGLPGLDVELYESDTASGRLRSVDVRIGSERGRRILRGALTTGRVPAITRDPVGRERFVESDTARFDEDAVVDPIGGPVYEAYRRSRIHRVGRPTRVVEAGHRNKVSLHARYQAGEQDSPDARYEVGVDDMPPSRYFEGGGDEPYDLRWGLNGTDVTRMRDWVRDSDESDLDTWQSTLDSPFGNAKSVRTLMHYVPTYVRDQILATRRYVEADTGSPLGWLSTTTPADDSG